MTDKKNEIIDELLDNAQNMAIDQLTEAQQQHATQAFLDGQQEVLQQHQANKEELSGDLAPFMNVSLEAWAAANARLAQMENLDLIVSDLGLDMPSWELVNQEWNDRMARDTTATIATVYGQAFVAGGQGHFGAAGVATATAMDFHSTTGDEDPISFEEWIKITEHLNAGDAKGIDPAQTLAKYNMNEADWGTIGGYWALKMNSDVAKYGAEFQKYSDKYSEQFENEC